MEVSNIKKAYANTIANILDKITWNIFVDEPITFTFNGKDYDIDDPDSCETFDILEALKYDITSYLSNSIRNTPEKWDDDVLIDLCDTFESCEYITSGININGDQYYIDVSNNQNIMWDCILTYWSLLPISKKMK